MTKPANKKKNATRLRIPLLNGPSFKLLTMPGLIALFVMLFIPLAHAETITGNWTSMDDKTGEKRIIVHIDVVKGILKGRVIGVFPQPGDSPFCVKCPGKFKNQLTQGIEFIWGLKKTVHGVWDGGYILNPKSGRIYRLKLAVKGDQLYVRGYLGFSILGRTQVWVRS